MKIAAFFLLALLLCLPASLAGEFLSPEGVVLAAIVAAHEDKTDLLDRCCDRAAIAAHPRHSVSADSLTKFLRQFPAKDVRFEPPASRSEEERVTVRMIAPRRLDFDLAGSKQMNGTLWRIVGIHP